jgi:DNA-directed RNA polymerase specialized sigma subunit
MIATDDRHRLVETHLGLAGHRAKRFTNRGELSDDLVQVASLALVKAAEHFDPDRGLVLDVRHHHNDRRTEPSLS